jgi:iron(III) transport system substrate-binding protein
MRNVSSRQPSPRQPSPRRRAGRRRPGRVLAGALAVVLVVGALSACSSSESERLTIYSGRTQELIEPLLQRFSDDTGTGIDVRYGNSPDLALLIDEEGDQSPADVFLSQSPGSTGYLDAQDRLQKLPKDLLDLVPARFRAKDGDWVGISGRVRVLVYNPDLVSEDELPQSIFDVTKEQYRDQLGVAPPNASFQDFVTAMRELEGATTTKEWLEDLVANGARTYENNIAIVEAVGRGEIKYGLVNDYYLYELQAQDPELAAKNYYFPNGDLGSLILTTTVGVLDTASDTGTAEEFIRYLLSPKAQRFYAEQSFEYPLADGVPPDAGKPPLAEIESPIIDLASLGDGLVKTRQLIADSGLG